VTDRLSVPVILSTLHDLGVRSLMVEGGARVIGSFFAETVSSGKSVIDTIVVTVAPTFVGMEGVGYGAQLEKVSSFQHVSTEVMGRDTVVAMIANGS